MDDRLEAHIADWLKALDEGSHLPADVELRFRATPVDCIRVNGGEGCPYAGHATELLEAATNDASAEGKSRTYSIVAISVESGERHPCRFEIRRQINKTANDLAAVLIKQNTELHAECRRLRKQNSDLLVQVASMLAESNRDLVRENAEHRARSNETFKTLEDLRSEKLKRDLEREAFEANEHHKERALDILGPFALALGERLTGGKLALPAVNMKEHALSTIIKALNEDQLDSMSSMLGDEDGSTFAQLVGAVLNGEPGVERFEAFMTKLPNEKKFALVGMLNVGQQAALKEVLLNGQSSN